LKKKKSMIGNIKNSIKSIWQENNFLVALYIYFLLAVAIIGAASITFALITGQIDTDNITWGLIDYV